MTFIDSINEYKLENAPADCIQSVKFGKHSNQFLLAASWDSTVRFYDILNKKLCHKFDHPAPVLDCIFQVIFDHNACIENKSLMFNPFFIRMLTIFGLADWIKMCEFLMPTQESRQ